MRLLTFWGILLNISFRLDLRMLIGEASETDETSVSSITNHNNCFAMPNRLFVGGIPYRTTEDELRNAFAQAGPVVSVTININRATGRSNGFGFVEMETPAAAQAAIAMWNEKEFDGRPLKVDAARPREDRPQRSHESAGSRY